MQCKCNAAWRKQILLINHDVRYIKASVPLKRLKNTSNTLTTSTVWRLTGARLIILVYRLLLKSVTDTRPERFRATSYLYNSRRMETYRKNAVQLSPMKANITATCQYISTDWEVCSFLHRWLSKPNEFRNMSVQDSICSSLRAFLIRHMSNNPAKEAAAVSWSFVFLNNQPVSYQLMVNRLQRQAELTKNSSQFQILALPLLAS